MLLNGLRKIPSYLLIVLACGSR